MLDGSEAHRQRIIWAAFVTSYDNSGKHIRIHRYRKGYRYRGAWDVSLTALIGRIINLHLDPDEDARYTCPDLPRCGMRSGNSLRMKYKALLAQSRIVRVPPSHLMPLLRDALEIIRPGSTYLEEAVFSRRKKQPDGKMQLEYMSAHDLNVSGHDLIYLVRHSMHLLDKASCSKTGQDLADEIMMNFAGKAQGIILKHLPEAHDIVAEVLTSVSAYVSIVETQGYRDDVADALEKLLGQERWSEVQILWRLHNACHANNVPF